MAAPIQPPFKREVRRKTALIEKERDRKATELKMPKIEKARSLFGPRADFSDDGDKPVICPSSQVSTNGSRRRGFDRRRPKSSAK
jgi:hypothetical protein